MVSQWVLETPPSHRFRLSRSLPSAALVVVHRAELGSHTTKMRIHQDLMQRATERGQIETDYGVAQGLARLSSATGRYWLCGLNLKSILRTM